MRRIAFIIGDGVSGGKPLKGVKSDHRSYRAFLQSAVGGAWEPDEIHSVSFAVPADELQRILRAGEGFDYALVAYSGHGLYDPRTGCSWAAVNDYELLNEDAFHTGALRQLTILDSCREPSLVIPTFPPSRSSLGGLVEQGDYFGAAIYHQSCRRAYDFVISQADFGTSVLYACSPGEKAADTWAGGLFSHTLVSRAVAWADATRQDSYAASIVLTDEGGLRLAATALRRSRQHPAGCVSDFPWAVA